MVRIGGHEDLACREVSKPLHAFGGLSVLSSWCFPVQIGSPPPKSYFLEFALVRCGSHADLACEEAPEICAHLEPLPSPRKDPQCKFSAAQDSDCIDIPWEEAVRACMRQQPMPAGVPGPLGIVMITDLASSQPRAMQHSHSKSGSLNCVANTMHAVRLVYSPSV